MGQARCGAVTVLAAGLFALVSPALVGCHGREEGKGHRPLATPGPSVTTTAGPGAVAVVAASASDAPPRPRYLRPDAQGVMVDAFRFPSVPASMVEKEVRNATTRRAAAAILHRFGVNPPADRAGEVSIEPGSLVDGRQRERLLVVAFRGELDDHGLRDEDDWLVFLGSTEDERLIGLGSGVVSARTADDAPIAIELRALHSADVDDVVVTWSSCATAGAPPTPTPCRGLTAWTLERGFPERIVDVRGDDAVSIDGDGTPPHDVIAGGRVLRFDPQAFAYR